MEKDLPFLMDYLHKRNLYGNSSDNDELDNKDIIPTAWKHAFIGLSVGGIIGYLKIVSDNFTTIPGAIVGAIIGYKIQEFFQAIMKSIKEFRKNAN